MCDGSPAVVKRHVENQWNRRCMNVPPLDHPQCSRGFVAGRGASGLRNSRLADPVPLLPVRDDSARGTPEQSAGFGPRRHSRGE